jgi:hypothetical protein
MAREAMLNAMAVSMKISSDKASTTSISTSEKAERRPDMDILPQKLTAFSS